MEQGQRMPIALCAAAVKSVLQNLISRACRISDRLCVRHSGVCCGCCWPHALVRAAHVACNKGLPAACPPPGQQACRANHQLLPRGMSSTCALCAAWCPPGILPGQRRQETGARLVRDLILPTLCSSSLITRALSDARLPGSGKGIGRAVSGGQGRPVWRRRAVRAQAGKEESGARG